MAEKGKPKVNMSADVELASRGNGPSHYLILRRIYFSSKDGVNRYAGHVPEIEIPITPEEYIKLEGQLAKSKRSAPELVMSADLEFKVKEAPPFEKEDETKGLY